MEINVKKLQAGVAVALGVGIFGFSCYLMYVIFFTGSKAEDAPSLTTVSPSSFSDAPKIQKSAAVVGGTSNKVSFKKKDLQFTETTLYKSFTDDPVTVPLSDSRGRPDPFVPYAAP